MTNLIFLPLSPDLAPHAVTQDKKLLAHMSHPSPVDGNANLVANLFGLSQEASLNKGVSASRESTSFTLARKKHGGTVRRASLLKAQGAIQEQLKAEPELLLLLCVSSGDDGVREGVACLVVTPKEISAAAVHKHGVSSDDDD